MSGSSVSDCLVGFFITCATSRVPNMDDSVCYKPGETIRNFDLGLC